MKRISTEEIRCDVGIYNSLQLIFYWAKDIYFFKSLNYVWTKYTRQYTQSLSHLYNHVAYQATLKSLKKSIVKDMFKII